MTRFLIIVDEELDNLEQLKVIQFGCGYDIDVEPLSKHPTSVYFPKDTIAWDIICCRDSKVFDYASVEVSKWSDNKIVGCKEFKTIEQVLEYIRNDLESHDKEF